MSGRARGLAALVALAALAAPAAGQQRSAYEELQTFSGVLNNIRLNYVDSVSYAPLVRAAIAGMLRALDPHSAFIARDEQTVLDQVESGRLAAIGARLEEVDGALTLTSVGPDGPAARAGIQPGDRLVAVDDVPVAGLSPSAALVRLAGEPGSRLRLTLERGPRLEPQSFQVALKRRVYRWPAVVGAGMADSVTGFIALREFSPGAAAEVRAALKRLRGQGARRLILDLRNNPGGVVTESVEIAAEFLPKKTLVFRTRGRKADVDADFVTDHTGDAVDLPLILLVDGGSASASEALAGALQDHDRALVLGRRTFGKALVQTGFPLQSGDVVWLTIGRVLTPSGRFIQRRYTGLSPEQYRALRGTPTAAEDTTATYRTDAGRVVRG
ncbi:MAG: S41 family peptidase, partial [Gemmatimonadetes bacterium]|nr:S41 family peptidase [Gemmatimonadota bacterium]